MMYKWFDRLKEQGYSTVAFVIMPNHVHTIHYFPKPGFNLNKIIGNAKRFMAYEIIKRPEQQVHEQDTLNYLASVVTGREKKKGQVHKVFSDSFFALVGLPKNNTPNAEVGVFTNRSAEGIFYILEK